VRGLVGALAFLLGERGLVNEDVGALGNLEHRRRRCRVARQYDRPPGPRVAQHLFGHDPSAVAQYDGFPGLKAAEVRPRLHAERLGCRHVEAPRPGHLDEGIAVRRHAVGDSEHDHAVVAAVEHVAVVELDELESVRKPPEDALQRREQVGEPRRAVNRQRRLAAAQRERLQHPGQPQVVVGVVMGDEDLRKLGQPNAGAQELTLRAFPAVDEHALAAPADQGPGKPAARRRHGPRSAEEDEVEVHGASLRGSSPHP
jgi:hypothetical protein